VNYRDFAKVIVLPFIIFTASAALGFIYQMQGPATMAYGAKFGESNRNRKPSSTDPVATPNPNPIPVPTPMPAPTPNPAPIPDMYLKPDDEIEKKESRKELALCTVPEKLRRFEPYGILSVRTDYYSTQITGLDKSTQGVANLYSRSNYSVGLEYNHEISRSFETIFYFYSRQLTVVPPMSGNLPNNVDNLYSFGVGGTFWNERRTLGLGIKLGSEQIPFLKGISTTQSTMDQLSVPNANVDLKWNFYNSKPFTIGADLGVMGYLPTNSGTYQSYFNTGFQGRLYVIQNVSSKFRIELGGGGRFINENTSIVSQQQTDYGVDLKLSIPLGGDFDE
jgi:hypothetical protein